MPAISVGNAPCSWGMLEFEDVENTYFGYTKILDEPVEAGDGEQQPCHFSGNRNRFSTANSKLTFAPTVTSEVSPGS